MSGTDGSPRIESELLRQRIRLYLYGELPLEERIEIERSRDEDPAFRALFHDEAEFLGSLGGPEPEMDLDPLLARCRARLEHVIAQEPSSMPAPTTVPGVIARIRNLARTVARRPLAWQPVAAALLLMIGFVAGRRLEEAPVLTAEQPVPMRSGQLVSFAADPALTGVEAVRLDPVSGQVQIVVEQRQVVSGDSSDPVIRGMLLATVQGAHTGAKLTSLDALGRFASERDIRETLLRTMIEDDDVGVRLKALEAVRDQASRPDVRAALMETLQMDSSPGMRAHAVEILRDHAGRDIAGSLQELVERESNAYVLQETERILESLGASMERY